MYNQYGEIPNQIEQNVNNNIPQSKSTLIIDNTDKPKLKSVKKLTPNKKSSKKPISTEILLLCVHSVRPVQ